MYIVYDYLDGSITIYQEGNRMSAYIKYPEEIQKCIDIYDPYGSQIANGELDKLPQEVIDAYNKAKKWFWEQKQ